MLHFRALIPVICSLSFSNVLLQNEEIGLKFEGDSLLITAEDTQRTYLQKPAVTDWNSMANKLCASVMAWLFVTAKKNFKWLKFLFTTESISLQTSKYNLTGPPQY